MSISGIVHGTGNPDKLSNPVLERNKKTALGGSTEGKGGGMGRIIVRFVGYRVRPLDPDNFAGSTKNLLDGLRHAGIIHDDRWDDIELQTEQVKVNKRTEECTEVKIIWP